MNDKKMNEETKQAVQRVEHNVYVSLKEHFEALLNGLDRRTEQMSADARQALQKAEQALERRLDLLNEFRAQAAEESKRYVTQNLYHEKHEALTERVAKTELAVSRLYGGILAVGAIGIINLVKLWFTH